MSRDADKAFLRACQSGELEGAKRLRAERPDCVDARSTSKGYTAMHYGAMGGSIEVVEWLESLGMDVDAEGLEGVTPLKVALEYKRLAMARRLQQTRSLPLAPAAHRDFAAMSARRPSHASAK